MNSITFEALQDAAQRAAYSAHRDGTQARVTELRHNEALIELATPINKGNGRGVCCPTGGDTGYGWTFVSLGAMAGSWSAQCGSCGSQSAGWVGVEAKVDLDDEDVDIDSVLQALVDELKDDFTAVEANAAGRVSRRVARWMAEAVFELSQGADEDDVLRGSEIQPGVYRDGDKLVSWDFDPRSEDGEIIQTLVA